VGGDEASASQRCRGIKLIRPGPLDNCCQFQPNECFDFDQGDNGDVSTEDPVQACLLSDLRPGFCNETTGLCTSEREARNVPTLSQWGFIAFAGVLGIIVFVAIRRRNVTA